MFGKFYEDLSNTYKVNLLAKKIAFVNIPLYHYVMRGGSTTGKKRTTPRQCLDYEEAIRLCSNEVLQIYPDLENDVAVHAARDYMSLYLCIERCPERDGRLEEMKKLLLVWMKNNWKKAFGNPKAPKSVRLRVLLFAVSPKLYKTIYYIGIKFKGKKIA